MFFSELSFFSFIEINTEYCQFVSCLFCFFYLFGLRTYAACLHFYPILSLSLIALSGSRLSRLSSSSSPRLYSSLPVSNQTVATMTLPSTITQNFLSKPNQLGVVAVGFNGGQVRHHQDRPALPIP